MKCCLEVALKNYASEILFKSGIKNYTNEILFKNGIKNYTSEILFKNGIKLIQVKYCLKVALNTK